VVRVECSFKVGRCATDIAGRTYALRALPVAGGAGVFECGGGASPFTASGFDRASRALTFLGTQVQYARLLPD